MRQVRKFTGFIVVLAIAFGVFGCASAPSIASYPDAEPVIPYVWTHPAVEDFADNLAELRISPDSLNVEGVAGVFEDFISLPRSEMTRDDLFEIKYVYEDWRRAMSAEFFYTLSETVRIVEAERALEGLLALPVAVGEEKLVSILNICLRWSDSDEYQRLLDRYRELVLRQGDSRITKRVLASADVTGLEDSSAMDGPDKWIRIPPSFRSSWPFERWSKYPQFARYLRDAERVIYRGIEFRPGDVLIINLQNPSEGLFTMVLEGRNYAPHMGMYIEIETEQGRFPAIYEIHQVGVRAVPLHVFLSDAVSSYVEVYRHRSFQPEWGELLDASARQILLENQGFNLFADEDHSHANHYLTCTSAVEYLVEKSGIALTLPGPSKLAPTTLAHVEPLGFETAGFLSPTDIVQWDQMELVGIIDNGYFSDNITRQLVNERLSERLANDPLSLNSFDYRLFRWASELIVSDTPVLAPILRTVFGYTKENFPVGTKEILAFMELIQMDINKSVKNLKPRISKVLPRFLPRPGTRELFSVHAMIEDPMVRALTDAAMAPVNRWFASE
jgi:hypothetical protein